MAAVTTVHKLETLGENVNAISWMECSQHVQLPKHNKRKMKQKVE